MVKMISIERSRTIAATPDNIRTLISHFSHWKKWSPWEDLDPDMERTYTGEDGSAGSGYAWSGNRKAGAGEMRLASVSQDQIQIHLDFLRPKSLGNMLTFRFEPQGTSTVVQWNIEVKANFFMRLFVRLDNLIGKDFDKGLRQLAQACER